MRIKPTILILFIISCVLIVLPNTKPVTAQDTTIYIRADGSVEGTDKIQRDGNLNKFVFLDDIVGQSIVVERIVSMIDGEGFTLQGNGNETGISLLAGGTIKDVNVSGFSVGIFVEGDDATVSGCNITDCGTGVKFEQDTYRISNSLITGNNITGNQVGISINMGDEGEETGMLVVGNLISKNNVAIYFDLVWGTIIWSTPYAMDVEIFKNSFIDNNNTATYGIYEIPAFPVWIDDYTNIWDNGSEGNYWSDYNGTDNDLDGVGDSPYVIDEYNQDNYPLMAPVNIEEIPEFPSWTIVPLLLVATLTVIVYKKKLPEQKSSNHI